jgi:hypothetical protein
MEDAQNSTWMKEAELGLAPGLWLMAAVLNCRIAG